MSVEIGFDFPLVSESSISLTAGYNFDNTVDEEKTDSTTYSMSNPITVPAGKTFKAISMLK